MGGNAVYDREPRFTRGSLSLYGMTSRTAFNLNLDAMRYEIVG